MDSDTILICCLILSISGCTAITKSVEVKSKASVEVARYGYNEALSSLTCIKGDNND